jgi:hypothetical protein
MNAVERRIACGCDRQVVELIGGAEGDRTLDLRIANAASGWRQVAIQAAKLTRNTLPVTSAFSWRLAGLRRF